MPAHTKIDSSSWRKNKVFVKTGTSTWSYAPQVYVKTSYNTWSPLYSYSWEVGNWGECTPYCSGTQTRSVRCKNNTLNIYESDYVCTALVGSKPSTSQPCSNVCGMTIRGHWDDEVDIQIKSRSTNSYVSYGIINDNKWKTLEINPPASDWPLRMKFIAGNSGGHGCGSNGVWLTIPGVGEVNLISPNWSNSGGCWGDFFCRVHANGTVEKLSCGLGAERCGNAGYPNAGGEPSW